MISHLLNRFSLHAAKWNNTIVLALILIWVMVLGCIASSIMSQPFDRKQRFFWLALVILLPGIGVLAYLPFAFRKEDLPHMFLKKSTRSKGKKTSGRGSES